MSEYQYYEFRAIDRPLDAKAMEELRRISSRAEITTTGLTNEYHWGDFKGDPKKLMAKYFDAFLYFANWGTHRLMLRLPRAILGPEEIKPYCVPSRIKFEKAADDVVLDFWSPEDCRDDEWHEWRLGDLVTLRADLAGGDLRCLYLAWLSAVFHCNVEDDELEPPRPPGLLELSSSLSAFAEFMYLNEEMIAVAAEGSPTALTGPTDEDLAAWVAALPRAEKDAMLVKTTRGEGARVGAEALARFQRARKPAGVAAPGQGRRTAGALRKAAEELAQNREQMRTEKAAREAERRERERAAERAKHLDSLEGKESKLWRKVDELVQTKQQRKYDEAVALIQDLHELSQRGTGEAFRKSLRALYERHSSKSSFTRRVRKVGVGV